MPGIIAGAGLQDDILFSASFDKGFEPEKATGEKAPLIEGAPSLTDGKIGQGLIVGRPGTFVSYATAGNMKVDEGTIAMWVKSVNWTLPDHRFHVFFQSAPFFMLYSYYEGNPLWFWASQKGYDGPITCASYYPKWAAGEWRHLAATWQGRTMKLYFDGELKAVAQTEFPLRMGARFAVGPQHPWPYEGPPGHEPLSVIDEFKIYKRPLTAGEVRNLNANILTNAAPLNVEVQTLPNAGQVQVELDVSSLENTGGLRARICLEDADASVNDFTQKTATVSFDLRKLKAGEHIVKATLTDRAGKIVAEDKRAFLKLDRPVWLEHPLGLEDRVLKPWTPVEVQARRKRVASVRVWNREYRYGAGCLPDQIVNGGAEILDGPMQLTLQSRDGADEVKATTLVAHKPTAADLAANLRAKDIECVVKSRIEFDGMLRVDLQLTPRGAAAELQALTLDIPLKAGQATLYHYNVMGWSGGGHSDAVPDNGLQIAFVPVVWLGDNDRGLCWFAESTQGWSFDESAKPIEVIRAGARTILRIRFVSKALALQTERTITFGLLPTPVKPMPADWRHWRIGKKFAFTWFNAWTDSNSDPLNVKPQFKTFVADARRNGPPLVPYQFLSWLKANTPEARYYQAEWQPYPPTFALDENENPMISVCTLSQWSDMLVYALAKLMDEYGVAGVYLDGAVGYQCANPLHGHGWRDDNGQWRTQYNIFGLRNFYRRLATAFEERNKDYIIWAHMSGAMAIPALSFATMTWDGEQFSTKTDADYTKLIGLDGARAEFMGRQWGLIPQVLVYGQSRATTDSVLATFLPLGLADNLCLGWIDQQRLRQVWAIQDAFRCEEAEFVPYWNSGDEVVTLPESKTLVTSLWKRQGKQLLVVCNLGEQAVPATLRPKMATKTALDAETFSLVPVQDGLVQIVVPAKSWKMIVLEYKFW